ncbi:MAG: hypothetical protein M3O36_12865, partial [Myxococcota bacterium]|nr:hypothetical protein [Myxococcota bacterium]
MTKASEEVGTGWKNDGLPRMRPLRSFGGVQADVASALAVAIASARNAWLRADFRACIETLEPLGLRAGDTDDGAEGLLLYGRALLRSEQPLKAKQLLAPAIGTFCTADAECTAGMLHAAAVTRCDTPDDGLALLRRLVEQAECLGAHRAIRTEISYYCALAHWANQELEPAARCAREVEQAHLDVLSVRATQLLGFIALAQQRYSDALERFRLALAAYRVCYERDRDLVEQILVQIATLEAQLRSRGMPGSYRSPSARRVPGDAFGSGASTPRCQIKWLDAWQHAHDGDVRAALRSMRESEFAAPTQPWKIFALAGRASISASFGESENAREVALHAAKLAEGVEWDLTRGEERFALILLAEALAGLEPAESARVLARFDAIGSKLDDLQFAGSDPRKLALVSYVRGLVVRARGDGARARALLKDAQRGFEASGHLWRAALAFVELDATHAPGESRTDFYLEQAALVVRDHFPSSFLTRRLGRWNHAYSDPIAARLTRAQRQILRYALDGYGAKEIASSTGRSVKTIGNQLASLHEAFGVHST